MSLAQLLLILAVVAAAVAALTHPSSSFFTPIRLNLVAAAVGLVAAALLVQPGFHFT